MPSGENRVQAASSRLSLMRAFGERLTMLRNAAGLSPQEFAERSRVSPSIIAKAEAGQTDPRLSQIESLARGLGVSPAALIEGRLLRAEVVRRLLSGEKADPEEMAILEYDIHTPWHLGLITTGTGAEQILGSLQVHLKCALLSVSIDGRVLAWLGGPRRLEAGDIDRAIKRRGIGSPIAVGEPGRGLDGWRLTHDQAHEAFGLALSKPDRFARYADDPLLAAIASNDTLARSLTQKYLVPIRNQADGGTTLRRTLRAYIDLECNATSAAHLLKVGRRAVISRVRRAEKLIGRPIQGCIAELDCALRLEQLERVASDDRPADALGLP
jgi:transcriptional regulator with XRE-family HTH domain